MAAVFPDAAACLENIPGDRQIPDHPLVGQTVRDCLEEAMDVEALAAVLARIHRGGIRCVSRDTPEPSVLSHEILNARPYAFLDDAPLEERRTQAVYARRATEPSYAADLGALDPAGHRTRAREQQIEPRDADELHDALLTIGYVTVAEMADRLSKLPGLDDQLHELSRAQRICRAAGVWVTAERLPELLAVHPDARPDPMVVPPGSRIERRWTQGRGDRRAASRPNDAAWAGQQRTRWPVRCRLARARSMRRLQRSSRRASFCAAASPSRNSGAIAALLARIHRYTLNRLRAEIEPVTAADFTRFLFRWQHAEPSSRLTGIDGLRAIVALLDGYETAAGSWEHAILSAASRPLRSRRCSTRCAWRERSDGRGSRLRATATGDHTAMIGATPISLFLREHADAWRTLGAERSDDRRRSAMRQVRCSPSCSARGASFSETSCRVARSPIIRSGMRLRSWPLPDSWLRMDSPGSGPSCAAMPASPIEPGAGRRSVGRPGRRRRSINDAPRRASTGLDGRQRGCRHAGVGAAAALRRRVPAAADARSVSGALANVDARVSTARGARGNSRRAVRLGHVGRTVRAA